MNREIKFRAWLTAFKRMETDLFGLRSDGMTSFNSDAILMQFTGLKDSAGKEIYEGDITNKGVVIWSDSLHWDSGGSDHSGFYISTIWPFVPTENGIDLDYDLDFGKDITVIGNIYETPELLAK
jgi:uncharacterized phage protein (TIGR01671 family)